MNRDVASPRLAVSVSEPLPRTLLTLTFVTGIVDATSFLALGQVLVAMQTGNVIFLGLGIGDAAGAPVVAPLVSLGSFLAAGAVAVVLGRRLASSSARALAIAMALEVALLGSAAVAATVITVTPDDVSAYSLIALLAIAMGLRNTVARQIGNPNIASTVLNLTVAGFTAHSPLSLAGSEDLAQRGAALLAILLGALTGALLVKTSLALAIATGAAVSLAAGLTYLSGTARPSSSAPR